MTFAPTDEQVDILKGYQGGDNIVINAGAGTGKTATLRLLADDAKPRSRNGIYLAFNKGIATEAQRKFAGTPVVSRTIHSLAWQEFGAPRNARMNASRWQRWTERATILGIGNTKFDLRGLTNGGSLGAISAQQLVKLVEGTVEAFCQSAATDLSIDHILFDPAYRLTDQGREQAGEYILERAQVAWDDLQAMNGTLKFSHQHYLKMFALSNPRLDYDFILLDEAQDTDDLMIGLIRAQEHAQVVVVGDRAQSIYGWRGAVSAMDSFGGQTFSLTQSFRFGDEIAEYANQFLALLGDFRVRGTPGKDSSVWRSERQPEAILTRTNMGALAELARAQAAGHSTAIGGEHKPKELHKLALAARDLHDKGKTSHPDLSAFGSWRQVQDHAANEGDVEIAALVSLVDEYGAEQVVRSIENCVPATHARTLVSTVHTSKGLEWKQVKVGADFRAPKDGQPVMRDEVMLAYVAATRAQRHLDPGGIRWVEKFQGTVTDQAEVAKSNLAQSAIIKKMFDDVVMKPFMAEVRRSTARK